jgi:hypothetical protein
VFQRSDNDDDVDAAAATVGVSASERALVVERCKQPCGGGQPYVLLAALSHAARCVLQCVCPRTILHSFVLRGSSFTPRVCVCVFVCARDRRLVVLPRSHRVMPCCACDAFGKEHDAAAAASARERGAVQEPQEVCIQRSEARRSSFTALHFTLDRTGRVSLLPPHICDCMSRITTRPSLVSCTCGTRRCRWRTCWPGLDGADTTRRLRSCTDILLTHREPASVWRAFSC